MGELFGVQLSPHNRWAGTKVLRERWLEHMQSALHRPVLLIDEAQEMFPAVLNELRLMMSAQLDSAVLLTVVLCGDGRLLDRLRTAQLLPIHSRIRVRLVLEAATPATLRQHLRHALDSAGQQKLLSAEVQQTLCEHAAGNLRVMMTMGAELLEAAVHKNLSHVDEKLYLEVFAPPVTEKAPRKAGLRR
jgi:type II secretory pathway predicted ATPase ExeA